MNVTVGQRSTDTWWSGEGPSDYCGTTKAPRGIWTWARGSRCTGRLVHTLYCFIAMLPFVFWTVWVNLPMMMMMMMLMTN